MGIRGGLEPCYVSKHDIAALLYHMLKMGLGTDCSRRQHVTCFRPYLSKVTPTTILWPRNAQCSGNKACDWLKIIINRQT